MLRFIIRDVFWFILTFAIVLAWWRDGLNLDIEKRRVENEARTAFGVRDTAVKELRTSDPYYVAEGWHTIAEPDCHEIGLDTEIRHGGNNSAFIKTVFVPQPGSIPAAYLTQSVRADNYRGKRLRLSAYIKTENATAILAMGTKRYSEDPFDTYVGQGLGLGGKGSSLDWNRYDVVLDIPTDAAMITFGIVAQVGITWVDDLQFEVVGSDVPVSPQRPKSLLSILELNRPRLPRNLGIPSEPLNLDFELRAAKR